MSAQRGYAMLTVLVVVLILLMAGLYGIKSSEQEMRSTAQFRRAELLQHAAEAGAALRLSEIALSSEPVAILDDAGSVSASAWSAWPAAGTFTAPDFDQAGALQFRSGPIRVAWSGRTPPPGVPVGTPTYVFEFTAFAAHTDLSNTEAGESAVSVAVKTWDSLPGSYAP